MTPLFRIAPTPSGYLHIGNAMSFVYTAQLAKKVKAGLLLRVDDMDSERTRPAYVQDIFDTLHFLQLHPSAGPANPEELKTTYTQQNRITLYEEALQQLISTGLVYTCSCSRKALEQQDGRCTCNGAAATLTEKDLALRIKVSPATLIHFTDALQGNLTIDLYQAAGSFVVKRKDGIPAYQLVSLCDDIFFGVTHIVRGLDLLHSTAMQLYLAALLQYTSFLNTIFYHHPVITDNTGEKLSKSAGATSIKEMSRHQTPQELLATINRLLQENGLV